MTDENYFINLSDLIPFLSLSRNVDYVNLLLEHVSSTLEIVGTFDNLSSIQLEYIESNKLNIKLVQQILTSFPSATVLKQNILSCLDDIHKMDYKLKLLNKERKLWKILCVEEMLESLEEKGTKRKINKVKILFNSEQNTNNIGENTKEIVSNNYNPKSYITLILKLDRCCQKLTNILTDQRKNSQFFPHFSGIVNMNSTKASEDLEEFHRVSTLDKEFQIQFLRDHNKELSTKISELLDIIKANAREPSLQPNDVKVCNTMKSDMNDKTNELEKVEEQNEKQKNTSNENLTKLKDQCTSDDLSAYKICELNQQLEENNRKHRKHIRKLKHLLEEKCCQMKKMENLSKISENRIFEIEKLLSDKSDVIKMNEMKLQTMTQKVENYEMEFRVRQNVIKILKNKINKKRGIRIYKQRKDKCKNKRKFQFQKENLVEKNCKKLEMQNKNLVNLMKEYDVILYEMKQKTCSTISILFKEIEEKNEILRNKHCLENEIKRMRLDMSSRMALSE